MISVWINTAYMYMYIGFDKSSIIIGVKLNNVVWMSSHTSRPVSLDITEQSHAPQDPVVWIGSMCRGSRCT